MRDLSHSCRVDGSPSLLVVCLGLALVAISAAPAAAQAPSVPPLIGQVYVAGGLSFVQLTNPSATDAAPLADLYLSTSPNYYRLVEGSVAALGASDVLVRFPAEGSIPASGSVVVQLGAGTVAAFEAGLGVRPDFVVAEPGVGEPPRMIAAAASAFPTAELDRTAGLLVLFHWDGLTDRVQDCDLVFWGAGSARVDKTGQSADGPDADLTASSYLDETAIGDQLAASVPAEGQSLRRSSDEVSEAVGGNGLTGHDETSEDLASAFVAGDVMLGVPETVTLAGTVVGGPRVLSVADLTIEVVGMGTELSATTDDTGAFSFEVPSNASLSVTIQGTAIATFQTVVDTGVIDLQAVEWQVEGLWHVAGVVVPGAGAPAIAGLVVTVLERGQSFPLAATGEFDLILDAPGLVTLQVDGPGIAPVTRELTLEEDNVLDLVITVEASYDLSGHVLANPTGEAVAGASVAIVELGETQITGEDGGFAFMDLLPGTYNLHVEAPGFETVEMEIALGSDQTIELGLVSEAVFRLDVTVMTSTGKSATSATVGVVGRGTGARGEAVVDEAGHATFVALRADNYEMTVSHTGFQPVVLRSIPVSRDSAVTVLLVPIDRQPRLETEGCSTAGSGRVPRGGLEALVALLGGLIVVGASRRAHRGRR